MTLRLHPARSAPLLVAKLGAAGVPGARHPASSAPDALLTAARVTRSSHHASASRIFLLGTRPTAGSCHGRWNLSNDAAVLRASAAAWKRATSIAPRGDLRGCGAFVLKRTRAASAAFSRLTFNSRLQLRYQALTNPGCARARSSRKRTVDDDLCIPRMEGRTSFRPPSPSSRVVLRCCHAPAKIERNDKLSSRLDLFGRAPANQRINSAVREALACPPESADEHRPRGTPRTTIRS